MITNYENAIDLDPTREEGYMDLLKKVYLADDEFSQEEAGKMTQILGSKRSGNRRVTKVSWNLMKKPMRSLRFS